MKLTIKNYSVGQGGMALIRLEHPADGSGASDHAVNILYDCGASKQHGSQLPAKLSQLERDLVGARVDWLILSHLHDDHINGLRELGEALGPDKIHSVMMPAFSVADLAVAAVPVLAEHAARPSAARQRLNALAAAEKTVRGRLGGVERFVFVRRESPSRGNPERTEEEGGLARDNGLRVADPSPLELDGPTGGTEEWNHVSASDAVLRFGPVKDKDKTELLRLEPYCLYTELEEALGPIVKEAAEIDITDTNEEQQAKLVALLCKKDGPRTLSKALEAADKNGLSHRLGVGVEKLKLDLNRGALGLLLECNPVLTSNWRVSGGGVRAARSIGNWLALQCHGARAEGHISIASHGVAPDGRARRSNWHVVHRYGREFRGPVYEECVVIGDEVHGESLRTCVTHLSVECPDPPQQEVAFLWTGDGQLAPKRYADAVTKFYTEERLKQVCIAQLPHHGSRKNYTAHLPGSLRPAVWHVSFGSKNRYRHPSGALVAALSGQSSVVALTDEEECFDFTVELGTAQIE